MSIRNVGELISQMFCKAAVQSKNVIENSLILCFVLYNLTKIFPKLFCLLATLVEAIYVENMCQSC